VIFTLLRRANVFSPEPLGVVDVLVASGAIAAIGSKLDPAALPEGALVVDLQGATVIPGLIDPHVHVTGGGGEAGMKTRVPSVALTTLAKAGVTTCVGVLGTDSVSRSVESLVAQTLGLREEGLSAYCYTGSYEVPPPTVTGSVRKDICFIDPVLGVGELAISDHRSSQPTFDELVRIAADCHVAGMMSNKAGVVHLHLGDGPRGLALVRRALDETELPASVFYPTHVNRKRRLFDEALEIAARGCTVDVTAFPVEEGEDAFDAADAIERYLDRGAPRDRITISSDGGGCLPTFDAEGRLVKMGIGAPSSLIETLATLLARGRPMHDVLPAFTANTARTLRLPAKGRIAPFADADLVVLDETHRIRDVMAKGRFLVRDGAPVVRGTFETTETT